MTEQEQKAFDQMLEALNSLCKLALSGESVLWTAEYDAAREALTAANAVSHPQATEPALISGYAIPTSHKRFADEILIQRSRQIEGPALWAVQLKGYCLSKEGIWEREPMPSSRDDDFLARCRFSSAEEAIKAATAMLAAAPEAP